MPPLQVKITDSATMARPSYEAIVSLCNEAYGEDLSELMATFGPSTHALGTVQQRLVSHAMWVTRSLQPADSRPRKTAYIEMVATHPACQCRGYATAVMQRLTSEIPTYYEMAALSPAVPDFYEKLGWKLWRGPLSIRSPSGELERTPQEIIMVLPLPGRAPLNLDEPLSAEWREGEVW